jgi:BirA family transcriptional regulator, biotin operon repressor / biotin---[acetyl-CoA-carboxylase] ligase
LIRILIRTVAETASTNADVLVLAQAGEAEGLWLRAERQTAGRGRLGRDWASPTGNLYASHLVRLRPNDPPASTLGFVVAVALHDVLTLFAPMADFQIKWPNDVLASRGKLSGILLERTGDAVVIGVGVNLASHPDIPDRKTTSLAQLTSKAVDPAVFLDALAESFDRLLQQWRGGGWSIILQQWRAKAHPMGTALTVNLPDGTQYQGMYQGIDDTGILSLRLAGGEVRAIHAGDVFLV